MKRQVHALIVAAIAAFVAVGISRSFAQSAPPPISFVFAGPLATPDADGGTSVHFHYELALVGIVPDRIQILDGKSGDTLVDDKSPKIVGGQFRGPVNKWSGDTPPVKITEKQPKWLHEKKNTTAKLTARAYKDGKVIAEMKQVATYSLAFKTQALELVKFNK